MQKCFHSGQIRIGVLVLDASESHHLCNVLRLRHGESVDVLDGQGMVGSGVFIGMRGKCATIEIHSVSAAVEKLPRLTLLQAVLKHGNCDHIVREATSIGVHRLIFFDGKRSECKLATGAADRVSRWEAIAVGACKQSGNPFLPKIFHCAEISKYIEIGKYVPHNKRDEAYGVGAANFKFFGDLGEGSLPLGNILANGAPDWKQIADIFIAIGPEGDFSVNERDFLRRDGFIACRLSQNVLRSETAAIYALGVLDHLCHCHLPPLTS